MIVKGHNPKRTKNLSGDAKEISATFRKFYNIWSSVDWLGKLGKLKFKSAGWREPISELTQKELQKFSGIGNLSPSESKNWAWVGVKSGKSFQIQYNKQQSQTTGGKKKWLKERSPRKRMRGRMDRRKNFKEIMNISRTEGHGLPGRRPTVSQHQWMRKRSNLREI